MEAGQDIPSSGGGGLLARYVTGQCSAQEQELVERWIVEEGRAATISELKQAWAWAERPVPEKDVEAALAQLHERMQADERLPADEQLPADEGASAPMHGAADRHARRRARRHPAISFLLRGAAALALMAVAAVLVVEFGFFDAPGPGGADTPQARVYRTEQGQRALITLPDGSIVHLNAQSTLEVAAGFAVGKRIVRLKGEAYFDVARDEGRPFLIRTARATVRVLGTAFDVRAYTSEPAAQVVVAEGRVTVRPSDDTQQSASPDTLAPADPAVVLHPRQMAVVSGEGLLTTRHHVDLDPYLAWTEGRLVFEEAPFEEVVRELERWYDLQIDVTFPYKAVPRFNGTFGEEPLEEVLTIIATSLGLTYEREGRQVTFSRAEASAETLPGEGSRPSAVRFTRL